MNAKEWMERVSSLTGLPYYEQHRLFGDKSGVVIGTLDGYLVAAGLGKTDDRRSSAVRLLVRCGKTDANQLKSALKPAKGKFANPKTEETGVTLARKYSFGKPDAESVADDIRSIIASLKPAVPSMAGKCEGCQRSEPQITLLNGVPGHHCASCQERIRQELNAAAMQYDSTETNMLLGLLYGSAAALIGSLAWGGVAYLVKRIFLYGAILIGLLVGKAVRAGAGKMTWPARIMIGALTVASILCGNVFFYALIVMKLLNASFGIALRAVLQDFWKIQMDSSTGIISIIFALIGAGIVVYGTRKPEFQARFEPLGAPAPTLVRSASAG